MLEAKCNGEIVRAAPELSRDAVYLCKDEHCDHPEMELCAGPLRKYFRHKRRSHCYWHGYKETEWHREWKSHFDRVEVYMGDDENGSANWADAVVGENFVVEFQHSGMKEEERAAREKYYTERAGGMVWIVDACTPRYLKRLEKIELGACNKTPIEAPYYYVHFPEEAFSELWIDRPVGVVFDYGPDKDLFYLMPGYDQYEIGYGATSPRAVGRFYKREDLIEELKTNPKQFTFTPDKIRALYRAMLEQKKREEVEARNAQIAAFSKAAQAAQARAIQRQRGNDRRNTALEPIGNTGILITAWGETFTQNANGTLNRVNVRFK